MATLRAKDLPQAILNLILFLDKATQDYSVLSSGYYIQKYGSNGLTVHNSYTGDKGQFLISEIILLGD